MEGNKVLTHNPNHFKLQNIVDKKYWCEHRPSLTYFTKSIERYNKRTLKKTEKLRLNARNTAICMLESAINAYNNGNIIEVENEEGQMEKVFNLLVIENGKIFYETSKFLAKHLYLASCEDPRTAEEHLKRIQLAIDKGCNIFLSYHKNFEKKHRFDCNARFEINPELLEITDRREHYTSKKRT
ncbi:hypothetical protein ACE193_15350 [Bernardetia sp. OM2101]|uniref:hypothetical protein n=1 Tax=Bernardetia sp. OM2101 TaxID=3344876 RepID=UPI0035D00184